MAVCLGALTATPACAQSADSASSSASSPVILDKVVAVVNNHAILYSDIDDEIRISVLDPGNAGLGALTRKRAMEQLIARSLIQQQIRQEDEQSANPTQAEVNARLMELRTEIPPCIRQNCASAAGWAAFLAAHGLKPERVESYLRYRLEILGFIERRFRPGIRITPQEIETYYHDKLVPEYTHGESIPKLTDVSARIEEILLQQRVNVMFDDWLEDLRRQGDVEVLDPTLEAPTLEAPPPGAPTIETPAAPGTPAPAQAPEGGNQ